MKHIKIIFGLLFLSFLSCQTDVKVEDLGQLNGFWEIEKVEMPDGSTKEFKINESLDFIKYDKMTGSRNKVIPQLDGGLLSNNLYENFTIIEKDKTFWLNYKTEHTSWTEELIKLSNDKLVVKNSNDLMYFYTKRTDLNK